MKTWQLITITIMLTSHRLLAQDEVITSKNTSLEISQIGETATLPKESPRLSIGESLTEKYLTVEKVPLATMIKTLTKQAGINYIEYPEALELLGEDVISLEMKEPSPEKLIDQLLSIKGLELDDNNNGLFAVHKMTNKVSMYTFQITDNFMDKVGGGGGGNGISSRGSGGGSGGSGSTTTSAITAKTGSWTTDDKWLNTIKDIIKDDNANNNVIFNSEKQLLILYGTKIASKQIAEYLATVDTKNPNIYVQVRIFATSANPMQNLGIDWSGTLRSGVSFNLNGNNGSNTNSSGMSLTALGNAVMHPMSSIIQQPSLNAVLNFFAQDNTAESVSSPSALTANNREVVWAATSKIPYIGGGSSTGGSTISGSSINSTLSEVTEFVEVGTTLSIMPRIQSGQRLKINTAITVSSLDNMLDIGQGRKVPQTSGRAYTGEFTVDSGETVVIAGLRENTKSITKNKVPWLGDIPGLGRVFRNESNSKNVSYLTVLITPMIVRPGEQVPDTEKHLSDIDHQAKEGSIQSAYPNAAIITRSAEYTDDAITNAKRYKTEQELEELNKKTQQKQKLLEQQRKSNDFQQNSDTFKNQEKIQNEIQLAIQKNNENPSITNSINNKINESQEPKVNSKPKEKNITKTKIEKIKQQEKKKIKTKNVEIPESSNLIDELQKQSTNNN